MYQITDFHPHALGLEKLTGSNRGLFYTNEQVEQVPTLNADEDGEEMVNQYTYDVYEVSDARFPDGVKDEIVTQRYPRDEEHKMLRKTLAEVIKELKLSDSPQFKEFMNYNDFVESLNV
ncbi:hypothetical protein [Prevotella sp. MGM1]|uniref:hypothetical protein n=1 Tax=Prevotella sp. MGM1 TaxID=2033405 RepID=UPI000CEA344E|nr:hypothetical protein [Prevotella sp. MGM1]GAY28412.1 hypothetical protein PvtlMGM1_1712 [Prevotella sp. MGM1]